MLAPRKVKFEAKKREKENLEFRTFLKCNADGSYVLGDCKPESCKKYPYTDQPERLQSLYSVLDTVAVCPVAFEIYERLKREYRFKK